MSAGVFKRSVEVVVRENERRLLIVDDEPDFCDLVGDVAEGLGYAVTKVVDSRRFKEAYLEFCPHVVVLDMVMPKPDGFDLVKWLIGQRSNAKLLIVTGYNPGHAKSAQLQSAARGLLQVKSFTKPISISKLRAALAQ